MARGLYFEWQEAIFPIHEGAIHEGATGPVGLAASNAHASVAPMQVLLAFCIATADVLRASMLATDPHFRHRTFAILVLAAASLLQNIAKPDSKCCSRRRHGSDTVLLFYSTVPIALCV